MKRVLAILGSLQIVLAPAAWGQAESLDERRARAFAQRAALRELRDVLDESRIVWRDGHTNGVAGAASDPDGERVVTIGLGGAVLLWDANLGELKATLGLHSESGVFVEFSPDGNLVLVVDGPAAAATLYDGRGGIELARLSEGEELVVDADFLPDGSVVTADERGVLRIWDALGTRGGRTETESSIVFLEAAPNGTVLTLEGDSVARVRDPKTGEVLRVLDVSPATTVVCGVAVDGRIVTVADDGATRLWPAESGAPLVYPGVPGMHWGRIRGGGSISPDGFPFS